MSFRLLVTLRRYPRRCLALSSLAHALSALPAHASESTQAADQHFSRGLAAAGAGKMTLAATEFERAYDAAPHHSVLYNLGLVYAALGRNADAVRVLRRYLIEGAEKVSANRRREVESIIQERSGELGRVTLRVHPEDAAVTLDARRLDRAELTSPVELEPGAHLLVVEREGYRAAFQRFEVVAGSEVKLESALEKTSEVSPSEKPVAVFVGCQVPDSTLAIDDAPVELPQKDVPLILTEGRHQVRFTRPGYVTDERSVTVSHGQRITCRMKALSPLPALVAGALQVETPPGSRVLVDGAAFGGTRLPVGRHHVTVLRDGYLPWQQEVSIQRGATSRLVPELQPTPEQRRHERAAKTQKTWALVAGVAGGGLMATGVALYLANGPRYDQWQDDSEELGKDQNLSEEQARRKTRELQSRVASIQQVDDIAVTLGALGVVSLGVSVGLYLTLPGAESVPRQTLGFDGRGLNWSGAF